MFRTAFAACLLLALPQTTPAADTLADLLSDTASQRVAALAALKERTDEAKSLAPKLAEVAAGTDARTASYAFEALGQLGPVAKDALPALKELAKERKNDYRLAGALISISGGGDKEAVRYALPVRSLKAQSPYFSPHVLAINPPGFVAPLTEILATDPDPAIRTDAARALGEYGAPPGKLGKRPLDEAGDAGKKVAPALEGAIKDTSIDVRREAVLGLLAVEPGALARVLPTVVALLEANQLTTWAAAQALQPSLPTAIPLLVAALPSADEDARERIASVMAAFQEPALPLLLAEMKHTDAGVRRGVTRAVGAMWGVAEKAPPQLVEALADPDPEVRLIAAEGLRSTSKGPATVPVFVEALTRDSERARARGAYGLLSVGEAAKPAVPALLKAMEDKSSHAALAAARALARIDPASAAPAVPVLAKHGLAVGSEWRTVVADELGRLGPMASAAVPHLTAAFKDPVPAVRTAAAVAAVRIDPSLAPDAVVALTPLVDPKAKRITAAERQALRGLRQIGTAAKAVVPTLESRLPGLKDDNRWELAAVILALDPDHKEALRLLREPLAGGGLEGMEDVSRHLHGIGPAGAKLVPDLIPYVTHKEGYARSEAADILADIGPTAAAALPALRAQLGREKENPVRDRIDKAIKAISGVL